QLFTDLPEVEWVTGTPTTYDERGRANRVTPIRQWSKFHFYTRDYRWVQQESTAWRSKLWHRAGGQFPHDTALAGDFGLWTIFFRHAKLYSFNGHVGGFRSRSSNQLSHDFQRYHAECNQLITEELRRLPVGDLSALKKIKLANGLLKVLRGVKFFNHQAARKFFERQWYNVPPMIRYDFKSNRYYLT
ncbi:MAG: hypothetical protein AAGA31_18830, partial [Bacteroidota bacterium]